MAENQPPEQQAPVPPSMEDLQAIAARAEAAANKAESAAQAKTDAPAAADAEAKSRGLDLPPELLKQIGEAAAAATVGELDKRFDMGPVNPTSTPADTDMSDSGPGDTPSENPSGGGDSSAPDAEPVVRKTWAQRFLGE